MTELATAIGESDPLGVLAMLHPQERLLLKGLYDSATGGLDSTGGVDIEQLLMAFDINLDLGSLKSEQLAEDVVYITSDSVTFRASVDGERVDQAIAGDLSNFESGSLSDTLSTRAEGFGVAVVNYDGKWYLSLLYTAAEITRRNRNLPPQFIDSAAPASTNAGSPEQAVTQFFTAISNKDIRVFEGAITSFEAGLVADYESTLGAELLSALGSTSLSLTPSSLRVVSEGDGIATVEVDAWSMSIYRASDWGGTDTDIAVSASGLCGDATWYNPYQQSYESRFSCPFSEDNSFYVGSILADEGWGGPRLVAVNEDGNWKVSPARTVLNILDPLSKDPFTALEAAYAIASLGSSSFTHFSYIIYDAIPQLYRPLIQAVGTTLEPATGPTTPTLFGNGRVGFVRVNGPATVVVGGSRYPEDPGYCQAGLLDLSSDVELDVSATEKPLACGDTFDLVSGQVVLILTSEWSHPLGPVSVIVGPLKMPSP